MQSYRAEGYGRLSLLSFLTHFHWWNDFNRELLISSLGLAKTMFPVVRHSISEARTQHHIGYQDIRTYFSDTTAA